ncbi:harpin HrpZ family protein [Pseudomonas sp. GD03842]|uniref:harpin HrpZ family protein n=1 Tax=unclassified Pseudomonas TaxID=196821 RepID=UPI000D387856|nr:MULTISPECIES: harpin HrpZ family protein [unclassified Pseudomonas]MDH0744976.1 harpin HrpZ family protein [Pseudomonas sp. GD03842]RAU41490.1 type III secretion protein HrpZ [Pseudomonas sp. RIT 409]RAU53313.1 type III secretion protein HrpZ [Pseudomonas sp. RIT 412]
MLSLNASLNPLQNAHIGTALSTGSIGGQHGPQQSLKDVINQLADALTQGGHLDQDSPLGKMVGDQMKKMNPLAAMMGGGSPDMVKAALSDLIKDKLGDNFGAAADFGLSGGAGKPDLMNQVLNGLGKASLDDLLSKQGDGTKFSSDDMPLLDKVAQFMDENPSKFPAPDSGSWKNELKEDNFLDKSETGAFRAALDMLGGQLEQQQNGVSDSSGPLGGPLSSPLDLAPSGGQSGQNAVQELGQLLGGLIEKGLQATQGGGEGITGQNPLFAQHDLQNSLAQAANAIVSTLLGADKAVA